jgi:hypothetical protein
MGALRPNALDATYQDLSSGHFLEGRFGPVYESATIHSGFGRALFTVVYRKYGS